MKELSLLKIVFKLFGNFEVTTLKQVLSRNDRSSLIREGHLENVNSQTLIAAPSTWCQLVYDKNCANFSIHISDQYPVAWQKAPAYGILYICISSEGTANSRTCRVRIYLRTCRPDFINCLAWSAHSFWHVIPRCSPLEIAYVTILIIMCANTSISTRG